MPLSKKDLDAPAEVVVDAIREAAREKGLTLYAVLDHRKDIEGSGATPFHAFTILLGGPKLSSMLLGKNIELSTDLPLRIAVVDKEGGCRVIRRDMHSPLSDYQMANADDAANLMNSIVDEVIAIASAKCSDSDNK